MNKNAVMPLSDYISACDKIRERPKPQELSYRANGLTRLTRFMRQESRQERRKAVQVDFP